MTVSSPLPPPVLREAETDDSGEEGEEEAVAEAEDSSMTGAVFEPPGPVSHGKTTSSLVVMV